MDKLKIGQLITEPQERDAIHMAVAPVTVAHITTAGRHCGIDADGLASEYVKPYVGVIDPFLIGAANKGARCWLFLYPGSITSLRHEWAHPAFTTIAAPASQKTDSELWMRKWAVKHMGEDYYGDGGQRSEDDAYASAIHAGHEHTVGPYEDSRDHIDDEWWTHWERITGKIGDRDTYFSCGC
jgi:hypothetical protein